MRILHVTPYFYPAWAYGGPPKAVYELALAQQKSGHSVEVLTTTAFEKHKELPAGPDSVNGIPALRLKNISNRLMWDLHFCTPLHMDRYLKQQQFDIVHLHEVRTLLNYHALLQAHAQAVILSPWGTLPHNSSMKLIKKSVDFILLPLMRKKITHAIAQTNHEAEVLKKFRITPNVSIVPLSINKQEFSHPQTKKQAQKTLQLSSDFFYFCFLGRFSPQKGLLQLLEVFREARKKMPTAKLLLIGRDDGALQQMQTYIQKYRLTNSVILMPPLYEDQRLLAYAASDMFVFMPTVYEETSTACLESLASGTPVITNEKASIPFLQESDGLHVWPQDFTRQCQKMIALYKNPPKVNRAKFFQHFTWNSAADTIVKIYKSCL